jgi:uncharacterized protein YcaQ
MGLIQIDSVNVLVRSQELPLFARLGPHPRTMIADATAAGELFEYWVHEASHVPTEHHHLHRWRMDGTHKWERYWTMDKRRPGFVDEVLRRIELDGPLASRRPQRAGGQEGHLVGLGRRQGRPRAPVLERADHRRASRQRLRPLYDLTERVMPEHVLATPAPAEAEARKELLVLAAKHHGVGTMQDLTDYHRQKNAPCKPLLDELVEEGRRCTVQVQGWDKPAYLHPEAKLPRRIKACALLSPFDPVCWNRDRNERLFGFHYRIEIYTPAPKRTYGYYVLPILWGDSLVGRLDLKADRQARTLLVHGSYAEPGVPDRPVAPDVVRELHAMAGMVGARSS